MAFAAGERMRISRDDRGVLHVHHRGGEVATIAKVMGAHLRVQAARRKWHLKERKRGWTTTGADPPAELRRRRLRPDRLTIAGRRYAVGRRTVRGPDRRPLLRLRKVEEHGKPAVVAEIVNAPADSDPVAVIALATAAALIGVDLRRPLAQESSGFGMGQTDLRGGHWHDGGATT